MLYSNHFSNSL